MKPRGRWALLAMAAALAALPAAAAVEAEVGFASPAQAEGRLALSGARWALLVFHGGDAGFGLRLDGPVHLDNDTVYEHRRAAGVRGGVEAPVHLEDDVPDGVAGDLGLSRHAWASLYVEADAIELSADGTGGTLQRADGTRPDVLLPRAGQPDLATSPFGPGARPPGVAAGLRGQAPDAPFAVRLEARGVRTVAWHNATLDCHGTPCPDVGEPWTSPATAGTQARRLSYVTLTGRGGTLSGAGQAWVAASGGKAFDAAIDGVLRLQDASLAGACGDAPCADPAGRTLRAAGDLALAGLAPDPGDAGRLHGRLDGDVAQAAFDEDAAAAASLVGVAGAVAAVVGLALLAKALLALFARSARPPALRHPRRRAAFDAIRAQPGLSYRDLQRRLGWPNGPLQNHVRRLVEDGLVVAHRYRNTVRYFENHGRHAATWAGLAQLHDPRARRLHEWIGERPGVAQAPIVAQAAQWGWSRGATQRLLRNLAHAGLVSAQRRGRATLYAAASPPAGSGQSL